MADTKKQKRLHRELIRQMITLATSGFGFVAALAWNEAIQAFVKQYIDKYVSGGSGVLSRFIYAVIITTFAVFITYQLSRILGEEIKNTRSDKGESKADSEQD